MKSQATPPISVHPDAPAALNLLEKALLTLQDGIVILSGDGNVQYINASAEQICLLGYGSIPKVGFNFFDYMQNAENSKARASFDRALQNEASERKVLFQAGDREYWFRVGYHPMPEASGAISHVCATAKDITEEVMLERKMTLQRQTQKNEVIRAALEAQEKERTFIGRELHDNVNQVLTTVRLYIDLSLKQDQADQGVLQKTLQHVDYCINEIRKLSHKLQPYDMEEGIKGSLVDALKALVGSVNETKRLNINFFYHGMNKLRISPVMEKCIYRVVQEQFTNILKHANATMVDFFIVASSVNISMRISDNGSGFDVKGQRNGSGINSMLSRVEEMKGLLEFESSPGEGCTMNVRIPLV